MQPANSFTPREGQKAFGYGGSMKWRSQQPLGPGEAWADPRNPVVAFLTGQGSRFPPFLLFLLPEH